MAVTYAPHSKACCRATPSFRGAVVTPAQEALHSQCDGTYDSPPMGPVLTGDPCVCDCHSAAGLPDWKRAQSGAALDAALATEARIDAMEERLRQAYPVLPAGRLDHVLEEVRHVLDLPWTGPVGSR